MTDTFSLENLINQYSVFSIPFLVIVGGVLISKFRIGAWR